MNHPLRRSALPALAALATFAAGAADAADGLFASPAAAFVHYTTASGTRGAAVGVVWARPGFVFAPQSRWSLQIEGVAGAWRSEDRAGGHDWVAQIGVEPVVRFAFVRRPQHQWFVDAGLGVNLIAPRYRVRDKEFSTLFNFSEHLGAGVRFGAGGRHEVALRAYHFSNGSIKRPNPGEDFFQVRYARWW